jgi:TolA-binding protein
MDRVKAQASTLAQQANQGMAKLDNMPAQRRADQLLRALGVAILAERTGRATGETEAQITQLLADIAQHEQQYNVNLVQQAAQAQAQVQQWQAQQAQMQGPGDYLTSAPPMDPNASAVPPGPGFGPAPGYGGQPGYQQPGGFPQAPGQVPQQGGFPGAQPGGFPQQQGGFPQQGGAAGFPPATAFPAASPASPADSGDEAGSEQGQSGFFPPASGV